jgi:hypothetical protein
MAYGSDITDAIPYPLSNPSGSQSYAATGVAFDVAFGGIPFFLTTSDENPYRRVTAQYRKQQVDMSREPGEQTLTGWWLRSQSSFHLGQGIKFFEPQQDESLRFQFTYGKGCDVWTKGQITLLKDVDTTHITTGNLQANKRPFQITRSIRPSWTITNKALTSNVATLTIGTHTLTVGNTVNIANVDSTFDGTYVLTAVASTTISYARSNPTNVTSVAATGSVTTDSVLLWDEYDVDKIDVGGHLTHFIDYNAGTNDRVYAICDDGTYAYWVTNDAVGGKLQVWKKLLTGVSGAGDVLMFDKPGLTVENAVMEYTKERIIMAVNDSIYEFATTATVLPTAVYQHKDPDHIFTSITSSGAAIYLAGYGGIQSNIYKFTLTTAGAMPTLTSAITAAELPVGEVAFRIYYYLGYMAIGTSLGLRIAAVSDTDGSINYGPLIFETDQPVYDVAGYDKYLWCTTGVDGNAGVTRVDLGQQVGTTLVFAYAWDLYDPDVTGFITTSCSFAGNTNRLVFCTANNGVDDGTIFIESASVLVAQATLRVGYIRYNTLENKIFKFLQPRFESINGSLAIYSIDQYDSEYAIGSFAQGADITQIGIPYPATPQQYLGFKFVMDRSTTDSTKGPLFTGYQIRVLPSIPRQRLIQYPVELYDSSMDKFNNPVGYEGYAYDRLLNMQSIENLGDLIRVEDFRTGESYLGLIEEMDFINKTPTDKRYSGYGGLLLVTIRTA